MWTSVASMDYRPRSRKSHRPDGGCADFATMTPLHGHQFVAREGADELRLYVGLFLVAAAPEADDGLAAAIGSGVPVMTASRPAAAQPVQSRLTAAAMQLRAIWAFARATLISFRTDDLGLSGRVRQLLT